MALGVNEARVVVAGQADMGITSRRLLDDKLWELEMSFWKRHEELSKKKASPTKRGKRGRKRA